MSELKQWLAEGEKLLPRKYYMAVRGVLHAYADSVDEDLQEIRQMGTQSPEPVRPIQGILVPRGSTRRVVLSILKQAGRGLRAEEVYTMTDGTKSPAAVYSALTRCARFKLIQRVGQRGDFFYSALPAKEAP